MRLIKLNSVYQLLDKWIKENKRWLQNNCDKLPAKQIFDARDGLHDALEQCDPELPN